MPAKYLLYTYYRSTCLLLFSCVVEGVLRDEHGNRFTFNYYGSDIAANQERYEEIGKVSTLLSINIFHLC